MVRDTWNPERYERFHDERSRPFFDLMALVHPRPGMRVVDLGCGTGELTHLLHLHLQAQETVGIDNSDAMLARSVEFAGGSLRFEKGDISLLDAGTRYDLVFSNAALHWVDGHEELLSRLTGVLADGGQIAVQVPANHDHPSHVVAAEVAREQPFRDALGGWVRSSPVLPPEEYARLLYRLGYREQYVRLQVYGHVLAARDDVVDWVRGTMLTAYQARLSAETFDLFLDRYRARLLPRLEDARPYFYPFKRILLWGQR